MYNKVFIYLVYDRCGGKCLIFISGTQESGGRTFEMNKVLSQWHEGFKEFGIFYSSVNPL